MELFSVTNVNPYSALALWLREDAEESIINYINQKTLKYNMEKIKLPGFNLIGIKLDSSLSWKDRLIWWIHPGHISRNPDSYREAKWRNEYKDIGCFASLAPLREISIFKLIDH